MIDISCLPEKFIKKIHFTDSCWLWTGFISKTGYSKFQFKGEVMRVHRFSWFFFNGSIPDGLYVCHKCDIRNCVSPDHLFLGTAKQNSEDMVSKGRVSRKPKGIINPMAKLSKDDVLKIRSMHENNTHSSKDLSVLFGVAKWHVNKILRREQWKNV